MKTPCTAAPLFFVGCLILFLRGPQTASADDAPEISVQPQSLALIASEDAQFSVTATGTEPLAYQWRLNHADIPGADSATYLIFSTQSQHAGDYQVVITNAAGAITSDVVTLTVDYPRVVANLPQSWVSVGEGGVAGEVRFSVALLPHAPLAYQWRLNGADIPGQTRSNLTLTAMTTTNGGDYSVWVQTHDGGVNGPATRFDVIPVKVAREQWRTNATSPGSVVKVLTDDAGNIYFAVNYHVAGFNIVKLNSAGQVLYNQNFKRSPCNCDEAADLALDSEGNLYVVGHTSLNSTGTTQGYLTAKFDASGSNSWYAIYGFSGGSSFAKRLALDGAGNVYVTGGSTGANTITTYDCATLKYAPDGNPLWVRRFDSGGHDYGYGIALDSQTNVVVTGESLTIKYDREGNQLWRVDGGIGRRVIVDTNDNILVASASGVVNRLSRTNGLDMGGSSMGGVSPQLLEFATDNQGRVYAVGRSSGTDYSFVVHSIMQDGTGEWNDSYPGSALAAAVDTRGNLYVSGGSPGFGSQCRIVKWNAEGWRACVIEPPGLTPARGVCVDKDFNFSVVGGGTVINYEQNHRLHTLGFQRNGSFRLTLTGEPRVPVWLKASTNLLGWLDLSELQFWVASADFTDADASTFPFRFYRTEGVTP
jgi:hypothetical protein